MPRPRFDREAIEAEIDRVRSLGLDVLRTLWRTTFRSRPPAFGKDILARFLCWHIQAGSPWPSGGCLLELSNRAKVLPIFP
jgi:hypothetical protein